MVDDNKHIEPLEEQGMLPKNVPTPRAFIDVERVQRNGGYFVGSVGWSGLVSWLIRKLVFFLVSGAVTIGGVACWVLIDESVRIGLRATLGTLGPDAPAEARAERLPLLEGESRNELGVRWKQLLSAVQLDQSTYPPRFVSIVRELTLADIRRIDQLAPYVVRGALLRNSGEASGHDIPALQWNDFARLKTIGVLQQGQLGQSITIEPQTGQPATIMLDGTTLALIVMSSDSSKALQIPVTALTEEGKLVVELLGRATSFSGLCEGAARLREENMSVRIWTKFEPEGAWTNPQSVRDATSLCLRN